MHIHLTFNEPAVIASPPYRAGTAHGPWTVIASAARRSIVEKSRFMDCHTTFAMTAGSWKGAQRRGNRDDGPGSVCGSARNWWLAMTDGGLSMARLFHHSGSRPGFMTVRVRSEISCAFGRRIRDAMLGVKCAVWLCHTSDSQRRSAPEAGEPNVQVIAERTLSPAGRPGAAPARAGLWLTGWAASLKANQCQCRGHSTRCSAHARAHSNRWSCKGSQRYR